jgi:hypothetical protein
MNKQFLHHFFTFNTKNEICHLGYDAVSLGVGFPTFRDHCIVSSRREHSTQ